MKKATRKQLEAIKPKLDSGVWDEIQHALKQGGWVWVSDDFEKGLNKAQRDPDITPLVIECPITFIRTRYVTGANGKLYLGSSLDSRHHD